MLHKIQISLLLIASTYRVCSQPCEDLIEDSSLYSVSMIYDDIVNLMYTHSDVLNVDILGESEFGQAIPIMTIENKAVNNIKKPILLVGNLHAREFFSSKFLMKFTNQFLLSLNNPRCVYENVSRFLDEYIFYIVPLANPDGLKIAQEDWKGIEEHMEDINKKI